MSRQLLETLNNGNQGIFNAWLKTQAGEPKIAWYPSAGLDFAPLFYLSEYFLNQNQELNNISIPDVFIFTETYDFRWGNHTRGEDFFQIRSNAPAIPYPVPNENVRMATLKHFDRVQAATSHYISEAQSDASDEGIAVKYSVDKGQSEGSDPDQLFEQLPPIPDLGFPDAIVPQGIGWFFHAKVHAQTSFTRPIIYLVADYRMFAAEVLIEQAAQISHLWWKQRAEIGNPWLAYSLKALATEFVFTNQDQEYGPNGEGNPVTGFPTPLPPEKIKDFQNYEGLMPLIHTPPNPDNWNQLRKGWYSHIPLE